MIGLFRIAFILVFVSVTLFTGATAQIATRRFASVSYSTREGLVQSQIRSLMQDSRGYLWICTKGGISRFNGQQFNNTFEGDASSIFKIIETGDLILALAKKSVYGISDNLVLKKLADLPDGFTFNLQTPLLLYVEKSNMAFFQVRDELLRTRFAAFNMNSNSIEITPFLAADRILDVFRTHDEWFLFTESSCFVYKNGKFRTEFLNHRFSRFAFNQKLGALAGYSSSNHKFYRLTIFPGNIVREEPVKTKPSGIYPVLHQPIILDNENRIIFADSSDKQVKLIETDGLIKNIGIHGSSFNAGLCDREGNIWIGNNEGIHNFSNLKFEEVILTIDEGIADIGSILQDENGTMWFGCYGHGLWVLDRNGKLKKSGVVSGLPAVASDLNTFKEQNHIGSFRDHEGRLYMNTENGIFIRDKQKSRLLPYKYLLINFENESGNNLYTGGDSKNGSGLFIFDKSSWRLKEKYLWDYGAITCLAQDKAGKMYVGTDYAQGYLIDGKLVRENRKTAYKGVLSMTADKLGNIWKATTNGLYLEFCNDSRIRKMAQLFRAFRIQHRPFCHLVNDIGYCIPEVQILPEEIRGIVSCLYLHQDLLFAATTKGLFVIDLKKIYKGEPHFYSLYNRKNGYNLLDPGQNGFFPDNDNHLWLTGYDRVICFAPELFKISTPVSPIIQNDITVTKDNLNWFPIASVETPKGLPPSYNTLLFSFDGIGLSNPDQLIFRHRLVGYSNHWSDPSDQRVATFSNLPSGKYIFEIICSTDKQTWSRVYRSQPVVITIPWYKNRVLNILLGLASIIQVTLLVLIINKYITAKREENRKLSQLKLQALRAQSIPHFTGNALNSISFLILSGQKEDAGKYLNIFNRYVDQTLMNIDNLMRTLHEEISYIELYLLLEKLRFGEKFDFIIKVDPAIPGSLPVPGMVLHTWCENALRHGIKKLNNKGMIWVRAYRDGTNVIISVEDNGIGREAAKNINSGGHGMGLQLVADQLRLLNEQGRWNFNYVVHDLYTPEGKASGSRFELVIPFPASLL